ncbi:MAG: UDP-N-acetylmuramoyl-tripeptide--D-alanyl-D-alanine ligase [Opitutaceae bacterium]
MPNFPAQLLAAWTGGRWTVPPVQNLTGFSIDSRQLRPGQIFVALKTEKRDGHAFLAAAQTAGASAALVTTPNRALALPQLVVGDSLAAFQTIAREQRRLFRGRVVGISGSAGKTSTKDLLALLLGGEACGVLATEGNLNNHLGVPLTLTRLDPAVHKFAVIEAGISAPGEMKTLAGLIEPDVSIITLVAPAHTEELGGIDGVAREKAALPATTRQGGIAIFSQATSVLPAFRGLRVSSMIVERVENSRLVGSSKVRVAFAVGHRSDQTALVLSNGALPAQTFAMRRVSDGMAQNAALAISAALWLGAAPDAIASRLASWQPAKLRGEIRHEDGRLLYLDCYNANPASMADALATFAAIAPDEAPRLYVIGCMEELGAEARAHHHALGRSLELRAGDRLFAIGPYAHEICGGLLERGDVTQQIQIVSSLEPAIACYADWRGAVFVKGSRRYQLETILAAPGASVGAH